MDPQLRILHADIESRCRSLAEQHADWPCRKGCADCCRRLAALPSLTGPEWELLQQGLAGLPRPVQMEIRQRLQLLTSSNFGPPFTCPFLDDAAGACLVYTHRPLACRMYGFYVERDQGLYCGQILGRVEGGELAAAVWGNACAMHARAGALGPGLLTALSARYLSAADDEEPA